MNINNSFIAAVMPKKYYTAIDVETGEEPVQTLWSRIRDTCNNIYYNNLYHGQFIRTFIYDYIIVPVSFCTVAYILFVLFGILIILLGTSFEYIAVYLFGRVIYDKNFPVCSCSDTVVYTK